MTAPVPQELVDAGPAPAAPPLLLREVVQLSRIGISDDVIVELIRKQGIADRPDLGGIVALQNEGVRQPVLLVLLASPRNPPLPKPAPRIVTRDLYLPLWPSYSRGHWHLGLRIACTYRSVEEEVREIAPPPPESAKPLPGSIDP